MSFEINFYENKDHWSKDKFGISDCDRYATLVEKLPHDINTLLDAGCGNGLFLDFVNSDKDHSYKRICGLDRSKEAINHVQFEHIISSIDSMPFNDCEFDAVTCLEVIEHLPQIIYLKAINEISRVARRYILISVPNNEDLDKKLTKCTKCFCKFNPYYHLRTFNKQTLRNLFKEQGFICKEVFEIHQCKVVPEFIAITMKLIGEVRRKFSHDEKPLMQQDSICPACGFSPRIDKDNMIMRDEQRENTFIKSVVSLIKFKKTYKWLGALYERQ